jgi:phosphonate transport system substrate-binding protein
MDEVSNPTGQRNTRISTQKRTPAMKRTLIHLAAAASLLGCNLPVLAAERGVRMVVTAAFVSEEGLPIYQDLANYVGKKIKRDTKIVSGLSYTEADLLLNQGIIQVGFVCGLPYTHAFKAGSYRLLAIPVMALKKGAYSDVPGYENTPGKYFSYTIVRKDSSFKNWQDLRGHTYAYSEQNSNSGYNMPRYKLVQLGAKSWEGWFSKIQVSGSHEESIRLVGRGAVDASSVDSLVLDYERSVKNPDALNVKVIEVLGSPQGAGAVPVVISNKVDPKLASELQATLLNMDKDPEGRRILDRALISRFEPPNDHNYDDIRRMEQAAKSAGFRDHAP